MDDYLLPSERRRTKRRRQGIIVTAGAAAALLVIVVIYIVLPRKAQRDPKTACRLDGTVSEIRVVILDATDEYNPVQRQWLRNKLEDYRSSIPVDGKVWVYTVRENRDLALQPYLVRCNPGTGEDESEVTGNPQMARKRWEETFEAPLAQVFDSLLSKAPATNSPILETIQAATVNAMTDSVAKKHMLIVSDLLQHTPEYSQYGPGPPSPRGFCESDTFERVRSDMRGWNIEIYYVRRDDELAKQVQGKEHAQFWDNFFSCVGATVQGVIRVDG